MPCMCQNDMFYHYLPIIQDNSGKGWISFQCEMTDSRSFLESAHTAQFSASKECDCVSPA